MDGNKLLELRRIGYAIQGTCGMCLHGRFEPKASFGTCAIFTYQHRKHVGAPRQLSVYTGGRCPKFEQSVASKSVIGLFQEFVK